MAGTKTSALAALTTVDDDDILPVVDVSDTSQAPTGSTKKVTASKVADFVVIAKRTDASDEDALWGDTATSLITPEVLADQDQWANPYRHGLRSTSTPSQVRAAFQSALDEAIGGDNLAAPGSPYAARNAVKPFLRPPGIWLIDEPLYVRSVNYLHIIGMGRGEIRADENMDAIFDINGAAYSVFDNFILSTSAGVEVTDAFYTYCDTTYSLRTSTANTYRKILVASCDFVTGFRVGKAGSNLQVDNDLWEHCRAQGSWETGETSRWQNGMLFGTGTIANNLSHTVQAPLLGHCRYTFVNWNTQVTLEGGNFDTAEVAVTNYQSGFGNYGGFRAETCERLYDEAGGSSTGPMTTLHDVKYSGDEINADGEFIRHRYPGTMRCSQVVVYNVPTGVTPKVTVTGSGANPGSMIWEGGYVRGVDGPFYPADVFDVGASSSIDVRKYTVVNASGQPLANVDYSYPQSGSLVGYGATVVGASGNYWRAPSTTGTAALTAGNMYLHPIYVPTARSFDRIGATVTVAGAGGTTISLGIYEDDGAGAPGALMVDAGTIDGTSATAQEKTISFTPTAGKTYWLAALVLGGSPTMRIHSGSVAWYGRNTSLANAIDSTQRQGLIQGSLVSATLPNPAAAGSTPASSIPVIALRLGA